MTKNAKGGKTVYLNTPQGGKVRLQTPVQSCPFGVSRYDDANGGASFSLDVSFKDADENHKVKQLWDACAALDEFMLDKAVEKSEEWFGKAMSREIVQEFYKPVVRQSSNPDKYKPTIRFKLNPPYTEIFDDQGNRIESLEYITKGSTVRGIVELSFWMVGKNFGVSLRAVQLQVLSRPVGLSGFAFADDGVATEVKTELPSEDAVAQAFLE
jgi:hypothetical protein